MTLQAKAFQWSVGIHGMVLLIAALLPVFAAPHNRVTVIDFTLPGDGAPPAVEQVSPHQPRAAKREPKPNTAVGPQELFKKETGPAVVEEQIAPPPAGEKAPLPEPDSSSGRERSDPWPRAADGPGTPAMAGKADTTPQPHAAGGPGAPTVPGGTRHAGGTTGRTHGAAEIPGSAGAGATPEIARAAYLKEHFVYIRDRITGRIVYPHLARKMGWGGQVKLAFVVCEDGGVNDVRVVESSGFGLLDRNAVDTVKSVAPFPSPPVRAEIRMAISYRLN